MEQRSDLTEGGFTLIELLVVILIIAILAAIAVPVFLSQREKAWRAQVQSALKDAATAIESYAVEAAGNYSALDGADSMLNNAPYGHLLANGYKKAAGVEITVAAPPPGSLYCITAVHSSLPATDPWQTAVYNSTDGSPAPSDSDAC